MRSSTTTALIFMAGVASAASEADKVSVVLLAEAGCPFCQDAIAGPLSDLVSEAGSIIIMEDKPWGNNYFETSECGGGAYDSDVRHCWAALCVDSSKAPADDCFTGAVVPQHGESEAQVNRMEACAKHIVDDWTVYWPFLVCMEAAYEDQGLDATEGCAADAGIDAAALQACYDGADGDADILAEAQATPDHDGVPTVFVDGQIVDADDALEAVCAAYTGDDPPAACDQFDDVKGFDFKNKAADRFARPRTSKTITL